MMETTIGRVFGKASLDIGVNAQATSGAGEKLEMALVLDTTGSMAGAKIDALKVSAKDLVNALKAKSTSADQLKIALVPFSQWVNVGMANRSASWIDVPADYTESWTDNVYTYPNATKSNCRMETQTGYNDGIPYTYNAEVCDWDYGDPVITPTPRTTNHVWQGCVGSRSYPLNVQDGSYSTKVPGLLDRYCPGELVPLTTDLARINTAIDDMTAYGSTYIPSGLVWGWRALSPGTPFGESEKGGTAKVRQALVLMTDGANTKSPDYPDHWGTDVTLANNLTTEICNAIKANGGGIEVYTIAFEVTDTAIKTILENCASSKSNYFDASDSAKLANAFQSIAQSLSALRLNR